MAGSQYYEPVTGLLYELQDILPIVLSIVAIILVALLEKQSKLFAALTATMPLAAPLALWLVYSSNGGNKTAGSQFSLSLLMVCFQHSPSSSLSGWRHAQA